MRTVTVTPETLIFYKVYGREVKNKKLYLNASGGKIILYNPGIVLDPLDEAAITDELDYLLQDSDGYIIMGIDAGSGTLWFELISVSGTVLQAPIEAAEVPYYIQDDGSITSDVTLRHIADGNSEGKWVVSAGTEVEFNGRLPVSAEGILSDVPFAAVLSGGELTPWNSGLPGDPTHIVWDVCEASADAAAVSVTAGQIFGPVPNRGVTAEIAFTAVEVGMYGAIATSHSIYADEDESTLIGYVLPSKLTPRLDSLSKFRYGTYTLLDSRMPDTDVYYYTDTDPELKLYDGKAVLNENATTLYFTTEGVLFFTYKVKLDPLPYWNTDIDLPEKITSATGILLPEDIDWLLQPYVTFAKTGDLEYHALLALHELGVEKELISEALDIKTWRAQSRGVLNTKEYIIKDPQDRLAYTKTLEEEKVTYIVALLCDKLGWVEV